MKTLLKFAKNQNGRDFVVGDIHGKYDLLMEYLRKVEFDKSVDRLFSTGDLIDRGEDSVKCLALCYEPWFHAVRGNHEQMMFDCVIGGEDRSMWYYNGGSWYAGEDSDALNATIHDLSEQLPLGIQVEMADGGLVGIVHADVVVDDWEENFQQPVNYLLAHMLWCRRRIKGLKGKSEIKGLKTLIVGHTPIQDNGNVFQMGNVVWVDVGSYYTNQLAVMQL